jgi:hypothetical protein
MTHPLNIDLAIDAIRHGFEPLVCTVEIHDFENQIDFRVLGPDCKPVARVLGVSVRDMTNPEKLRAEIQQARTWVERKGFHLETWEPPS